MKYTNLSYNIFNSLKELELQSVKHYIIRVAWL